MRPIRPRGAGASPGARPADIGRWVAASLRRSPAYGGLDPGTRSGLDDSLSAITDYLEASPDALATGQWAPARQLAPDLGALRRGGGAAPPVASPAAGPIGTAAPTTPASTGPTGRVGEVARATLNAIDFPSFVASLIEGTFQAIVDASIQQMEAYAELLKQVAGTLDQFMTENTSDGMARDFLADRYGEVLSRETASGRPELSVREDAPAEELPSFFQDLGFVGAEDLDEQSVEEVVVPAARRTLAEQRQQSLATMVMMGINRVVVSDGEITARLQFHVDASEAAELKFDQTKTTVGNMAKTAGRSSFTANGVMVNTASVNTQSEINVRADLMGQVTVRFRSETFPLERFADSYAIQLINDRAKVPPPEAAGTPAAAATPAAPPGASPATPAVPPGASPAAAPAPAPAAQSLAAPADPWWPGA